MAIAETLKNFPNQFILDIRPHLMKIITGTSLNDLLFIDLFSFDYYLDNYTHALYKNEYEKNLKKFKKLKTMEKINNWLEEKIANDPNVVKESKTIYWGFDNGMSCLNFREKLMEKEIIFPLKKIKYEHTEFYIPNKPEEYLSHEFSGHYMEYPKQIGMSHHNIYIKKYANILNNQK